MFFDIRQNLRNHRLGITPQLRKQSTLRSRIMPSPIPPLLVFPLLQPGYPLPAIPQVKKNQRVRKFDVLAVAAMSGHPCLFAPTSGTILDIAKADHPNACAEIRLQTDGKDSPASLPIPPDYRALGHQDLLLALAMAGIMDHGEQAQSLAEKLATAIEHRADLLVINAMESAPDVSAKECLAREFADEFVAGAEVLQAASLTLRCVIAISAEKQDAIAALTRALAASSVELQVLPNRYPAGHERVLTRTLTGLRLDWQQQPHDAGLVICDTMTAVHAKR
ncbi:MAG: hypothetical protein RL120_15145, partial [Gammaproteobacteria bacterium]